MEFSSIPVYNDWSTWKPQTFPADYAQRVIAFYKAHPKLYSVHRNEAARTVLQIAKKVAPDLKQQERPAKLGNPFGNRVDHSTRAHNRNLAEIADFFLSDEEECRLALRYDVLDPRVQFLFLLTNGSKLDLSPTLGRLDKDELLTSDMRRKLQATLFGDYLAAAQVEIFQKEAWFRELGLDPFKVPVEKRLGELEFTMTLGWL